jgi:hypothetical protein
VLACFALVEMGVIPFLVDELLLRFTVL